MKEYIGSDEHFQDEVSAYYEQERLHNLEQEKQIEKQMYEQQEFDELTQTNP